MAEVLEQCSGNTVCEEAKDPKERTRGGRREAKKRLAGCQK